MQIRFVEMTPFTRKVIKLGLEEDLRMLQLHLLHNPQAGDVEPGTCGLRKIRMSDEGRGQGRRFGARVHYFWAAGRATIYLFNVYRKSEQDALTPAQKKMLCALILQIDDSPRERRDA